MLLALTRTASPWIWPFAFGNSSRRIFVTFRARSSGSPLRRSTCWRTFIPPACSIGPQSKILSERFRRTALVSTSSRIDFARSSESARMARASFSWVISAVAPLKSKRVAISRRTWSSAFRSSWASNSETTSKENSPAIGSSVSPGAHAGAL